MEFAIKFCSVVFVALLAVSQFAGAVTANTKSAKTDLDTAASERLFDLGSWSRYPSYNNYRPPYYYGGGGGYNYNRPGSYYPNTGYNGYYPNTGYQNTGGFYPNTGQYYPNTNTGYPNTGYATGNGGYGGFGGNGGLTTYYGYGRDDYYGDRNMGFGYQQGTNQIGFSRVSGQNLNYNSYPSYSSTPLSSSYY